MQTLQVYVNDERIDLFSDESINVTQSIQNVRDISKIFTDFSRSFTIPASKTNNKIFKHYNNKNIVGGFDARKKVNARLEINNKPFREGKIKLDGANLKDGSVASYKITFFGNTVNLKDLLAEDKLETLDWLDNFSVNYSATDIREALQTGKTISFNQTVYPNAIVAPLITNTTRLFYDSAPNTYDPYPNANGGNTYYVDTYDQNTHSGVYFEELEYAIRVHLIVKAIEQEYGIVFSNDFFNETNLEYYNLYMWLHREKGRTFEGSNITTLAQGFPLNTSNRSRMESDKLLVFLGAISGGINTPINYSLNITTNTSSTFKVTIKKDGATYNSTTVENGTQVTLTGTLQSSSTGYKVYIDSEDIFNFTATWDLLDVYTGEQDILATPSISVNTTRRFIITEQTPNMRIIDFLNGLFKTFNLTAYQRDGVIVIDTLDDYYKASTKVWEIDKHIDSEQEIVDNALPFNEINFKYKGNNTFLAKKHANQFGQDWGKLEYTSEDGFNDASPNVYNVELPFEHMKYERLLDASDKSTTTIMYGWFADDKGSSYVGDPLIFYPVLNSGTSLQFLNTETYQDANSRSEVTSYFVPSNSLSLDSSVNTSNLNFYLQANEYTFTPAFTNTLFAKYYREYIRNVFDIRNRLTKLNAVLPLNFLLKFQLNDKIRFRGNYYKINSITSDLATGKANFELINEYDFIETIELDGGEGEGGFVPLPTGDVCPYADSTLYTIDSTEVTADRNCDNTKPADCPNADSAIYTTDTFDISADLDCAAPFPDPEPEPQPEPCNTTMFSASDETTSSGLACGLSFTRSLWHNGSTTYPQLGNRIYADANCSSFPDDGFIKVTGENTTIEVVRQGSNLFGTVISKNSCQSNFLPSVSTLSASSGQTTATLNGVVTNVGMPAYTTRGFYWMEGVGTPNASNNVVFVSGTDINTFSALLSNLQPSRTYSYVAFATNSEGTATGTVVQFFTSANTYEPTVVTNPATNILQTSATLNGRVSDVGNPNYTQKGFYWKLGSGTPTASDNVKLVSGTAPDNYSGNISGLLSSNLYSFRAFATNSVGTALGQVLTFSSASPVCDGGTLHFDAGTLSGVNMSLSTGQLPYTICDSSYDIDLNLFNNVTGEWSSTSEVTSITVFEGSTNVTSDFTITKTLDSNGVIIINLASDTPAAFEDGDKFYTVNVTANPSTTYQTDITVTQSVGNSSLVVTDINGNTVAPNNHSVVAGEGKVFSFTYTYTADSGYQFTGIGNIQNAVGNGVNVVIDSYTSSTITVIISGAIGSSNQTATASWNGDAIAAPATTATLLYRYGTSGTFVSIPSGGIEVDSQQVVQIQVTPNGSYYVGLSNNNAIQSVTPTTVNSGAQTIHTLNANVFTGGEGLLKTSFRVYPRGSVSSIASAVLFYQGSQ